MDKLSRMKKNEDLRNKIDQESTTTQTSQMNQIPVSSQSRRTSTHEKKSVHPYKNTEPTPIRTPMTSSPVIDDLLDEVRQYNMDKGESVSADTQMNILRQISQEEEPGLRKQHFLPMDEEDEAMGSTMKLPRTSIDTLSTTSGLKGLASSFRKEKASPLAEETQEDTIEEPLLQTHSPLDTLNSIKSEMTTDEFALAEKNFHNNVMDTDHLEVLEFALAEEETDVPEETPAQSQPEVKKEPKKHKAKKKKIVIKEDKNKAPKERMTQGDVQNQKGYKAAKKGSNILNIILIVLLVLLVASIGFVVFIILRMGK